MIDNFIKGPLTTLIGLALMIGGIAGFYLGHMSSYAADGTATEVQIFVDSFDTSFTLALTPDTTNYNYAFGAINKDSHSNVLEQ